MTFAVKSVRLPNSVTLNYVEQGDPSGKPVLLLHGVTDSWRSFELVLGHLTESVHAFAPTQRGHGDSSRPATGYRYADFAADAAAFMDALNIESAVIVGHSMGSAVAQRFAIDHPARANGLVLIGSFPTMKGNAGVQQLWDTVVSTMADPVDPEFVRDFQESTLAKPVAAEFLDTVVRESLKLPAHVWRAAFEGFLQEDFSEELNRIKAPTLIVWGDRDEICLRSDQDALLRAIGGSRLVVYHDCGHGVHWEEPERFASDLKAFVESVT